jgi:hypothetical protein
MTITQPTKSTTLHQPGQKHHPAPARSAQLRKKNAHMLLEVAEQRVPQGLPAEHSWIA